MIKLTPAETKTVIVACAHEKTNSQKVLTAFQLGVQFALTKKLPAAKLPFLLKKGN